MKQYNETTVTQAVLDSVANCSDPRFRTVMTSLVKHLHAFVREVDLTEAEWADAVQFLMETGQVQHAAAQRVHPALGHARRVDADGFARAGAQERDAQGRHRGDRGHGRRAVLLAGRARRSARARTSARACPAKPALYCGRVTDVEGKPLAGALLDVWSGDGEGLYDVQVSDPPKMRGRGRLRTDDEGRYYFWSIKPSAYPIPDDATTGTMLRKLGRQNWRPGHLHVMVSADRHVPLTTHLFVSDSKYLETDAVFAVRNSLIVDFEKHPPGKALDGRVMKTPYHVANYDFRLAPAKGVSA